MILITMLSGCVTTRLYQGRITALDSQGTEQTHILYWNKTKRKLWFDTAAGSMTLLSGCSTNTVQ